MKKAIVVIRTSTVQQEIDSQKKEILDYAKSLGYSMKEIEIVGKQGASAIKLDEEYQENLEHIYSLVEHNESIQCVIAWSVDRLGRNEVVLLQLKNFLLSRKVNLIIKNPALSLINPDGTVNNGIELAFSLFCTMAKQEMENKKARFHRAKLRNAEQMRFNGGRVLFGYSVNEANQVVINPEEAEIISTMFTMYASGKYSTQALCKELRERGIYSTTKQKLYKMLTNTAYIGYTEQYYKDGSIQSKRKFPVILEKELFDKVQTLLTDARKTQSKASKHYFFGTKLLKCGDCGYSFVGSLKSYSCFNKHQSETGIKAECHNQANLKTSAIDGFLWEIASAIEIHRISSDSKKNREDMLAQIEVIKSKIEYYKSEANKVDEKKAKVIDSFIEGLISKESRNIKLQKLEEGRANLQREEMMLRAEMKRINEALELSENANERLLNFFNIWEGVASINEEKKMYDIVHSHLLKVVVTMIEPRKKYSLEVSFMDGGKAIYYYEPYDRVEKFKFSSGRLFHTKEIIREDNQIKTIDKLDTIRRTKLIIEKSINK